MGALLLLVGLSAVSGDLTARSIQYSSPVFRDVPARAWFSPHVEAAIRTGLMNGFKDPQGKPTRTFGPALHLTYGQLAKITAILSGRGEAPGLPANLSARGDWSQGYVKTAELLLLSPVASNSVHKDATRGDVLKAILKASHIPLRPLPSESPFSDLSLRHPNAAAILTAVKLGIIDGYKDPQGKLTGTVGPDTPITRAEIAKLLDNLTTFKSNKPATAVAQGASLRKTGGGGGGGRAPDSGTDSGGGTTGTPDSQAASSSPSSEVSSPASSAASSAVTSSSSSSSSPSIHTVQTVAARTVNEGSPLTLTGAVSGGTAPFTYSWDFGDGTGSGVLFAAHTYTDNATRTAILTITDSEGRSATGATVVTIQNVAPTPNAHGPYEAGSGSVASFTGSATDPSAADTSAGFTYLWNFGDGTTSTLQNPTHTYHAIGTYPVTLKATDKDGGETTASTVMTVSSNDPGEKQVITPDDFTYLGYYDARLSGLGSPFYQGLTHRYVDGDLRFLTLYHTSPGTGYLDEFSIAGRAFGDMITATTNGWDIAAYGVWDFTGLWWDESESRLWTTAGPDYTVTEYPVQIYTYTLNSDGSVSDVHGPVGLEGIPAKRVYGGAQPVPAWFRTQYGVGSYIVGWGGYTSLMLAGGGASMGPTMYALPDPSGYGSDTGIPIDEFTTIMDSASAGASDWYANGSPTSFDRGSRITIPENYYDGGDTRPNGSCEECNASRPTDPPAAGAQWLSPAPDGFGRWVWADSNYNTGVWIDTDTKTGFLTIAS